MELELGLKITRTRDDDDDDHATTFVSELRIAKDRAGPVFLSTETHDMFILTAHLKGYKRNSIEIKISEDGREISINGEKPIQEMLMMGWVMKKNQVGILWFRKAFKIPKGVVLDRIKAKYNEDESILKIVMPKLVKGIYGVQIEEVKEEEIGESSQKASEIGENESVLEKQEGLSDKKLPEAANGDIVAETMQKEVENHRFEIGDEYEAMENLRQEQNVKEDHIPKNIGETSQEVSKKPVIQIQPLEESDNAVLAGEIGGTREKEIETEDIDEKRVGVDISKQELEALMETTIEGQESEKVLARAIGVGGEDIVEQTKDREIERPKFEIEDRDRGSVVREEFTKGVEAIGTTMKEQVPQAPILLGESENVLASAIGVGGEDINGGTKQKEAEGPKIETERVREEISKEGFEVIKESESVVESMEGGEDRIEVLKPKEIEEPKFESVKEEATTIPESTKSKVEEMEETEGIKEVMAKRESQEAEGFMEKVEGEEPKKMNEEARKVIEKDYTKEAEQKGIEENIVRKVFEVLGSVVAEFPQQMVETKAKREREVKMKGEVVIKMHDEAKGGFEKGIIGDRIHMDVGQPSTGLKDGDKGGFDVKETLEVSKREESEAIKEDSAEIEPSVEKVEGQNNEKVQVEAYGGFQKDKIRERTQKETEAPEVGTKHKDQQRMQEELPMQIEGSKDSEKEVMKETQTKSGETQLADYEFTMKEKIQETKIERMSKIKQITKALQVPEAKDPKALEKCMPEKESRRSTQRSESKEKGKLCEDCKRSKVTFEREIHRATQKVKDEKPRTKKEVKQVAESMPKTPEEELAEKSKEVERELPLQAKAARPVVTKEFEPKNEVEEPKLNELPPPKVEMQSKEPLESEDKSMKWKFPKTQKHVPEAKEEEEEYESGKPSEVKCLSSIQQSLVEEKGKPDRGIDKQKSKTYFLEAGERRTPLQDKQIEALQPKILADQSLEEEFFETSTEDRGQQYMLENFDEKRPETKKVAEEEKLNQKDGAERVPCKSKGTMIEREDDKKPEIKRITPELEGGDEKINEFKRVAEEFKEAVADSETEKSQKELVSPQTMEIQSKEEIPKIRAGQQEKEREIPFHDDEVSEAVTPKREVEPPKATATNSKATSVEFRKDGPKVELDKGQRKKLSSPSIEKLSKEPCELAKPSVKEKAPKVEIVPQLQEGKESIYPMEGTKALEAIANEVDKPSTKALEVEEKGKTDECCEGRHLEFQEPEKQESELDFQESTKRRSDLEVEKTRSSQQEESCRGHEAEEEKADEVQVENTHELEVLEESTKRRLDLEVEKTRSLQEDSHGGHETKEEKAEEEGDEIQVENTQEIEVLEESTKRRSDLEVEKTRSLQEDSHGGHETKEEKADDVQVENTQELEVLEDIEVEDSEDKKRLRTPLVIAGSAFLVSLIVFFIRHRRAQRR